MRAYIASALAVVAIAFAVPDAAMAADNATFTKVFNEYEETVDGFVKSFVGGDWVKAKAGAVEIEAKSKALKDMAEKDNNPLWLFDATNLWHHSEELLEEVNAKNGKECVYLVSTLTSHVGYIQAANPQWLRSYLAEQIKLIEDGITAKKRDQTRDAAEIVHVSAAKIVLSAGLQNELYTHIRWLSDVREINRLGDHIIEKVMAGDWETPKADLAKIKAAYAKWDKAFKG